MHPTNSSKNHNLYNQYHSEAKNESSSIAQELFLEAYRLFDSKNNVDNDKKVLKLYKRAADLGHSESAMILKVHQDPESNKTEAKKLFKKGLLKTNGIAELFLSDLYEDNIDKSIQFLKSGSAQGNTRCDLNLYRIYLQNESFKNHSLGYKHLIKAADAGYSDAQVDLAHYVFFQNRSNKNINQAREYYKIAARGGSKYAKATLASLYLKGIGGRKLVEKGVEFLEDGERTLDDLSAKTLAEYYLSGGKNNAPIDLAKAVDLYSKYSDLNRDWAFIDLEKIYSKDLEPASAFFNIWIAFFEKIKGSDNPKDKNRLAFFYFENEHYLNMPEAIRLWKQILPTLDKNSQLARGIHYRLASLYLGGFEKELINLDEARKSLQCSGGNATAADWIDLGYKYYSGKYGEKNTIKQFKSYLKAAELEDPQGVFLVGACYRKGSGTKKNPKMAFEYNMKALEMGYENAALYAGVDFFLGVYVKVDLKKAKYYLKRSKDPRALVCLGEILELEIIATKAAPNNSSAELNPEILEKTEKMLEYYDLASRGGNILGSLKMALILETNEYIEKDIPKAIVYYESAAERGSLQAMSSLDKLYRTNMKTWQDLARADKWKDLYDKATKENTS